MSAPYVVIGGLNLDIVGQADAHLLAGDSALGTIRLAPGGVGRNIAWHLAQAGKTVQLCTVLGGGLADFLQQQCRRDGIGLDYALPSLEQGGCYVALHDAQGAMRWAINDMRLMEQLTPQAAAQALQDAAPKLCILDANVPPQTLGWAARHFSCPIVADAVSGAKCRRLLPLLSKLAALKCNLQESQALSAQQSPQQAARWLCNQGVAKVFISLGAEGIWCADQTQSFGLPVQRRYLIAANGAGDAMAAGIAIALSGGGDLAACARHGLAFAQAHLQAMADPDSQSHHMEA